MRVSQYFSAHFPSPIDQAELDFVDVDVRDDKRLFIDPHALRLARTPWTVRAARIVSSFFTYLLGLIKNKQHDEAYALLCRLLEPNEIHLGYCVGRSRGHALGQVSAEQVLDRLRDSRAVQTGVIRDLEDTVLLIAGIERDIVSDMTANIIRPMLIEYTQRVCETYGIPMEPVQAGALWNEQTLAWETDRIVELPCGPDGALLFIPKIAARVTPELERGEYHRSMVATALQEEELAAGSELVRLAKSGDPKVNKKDVNRKYGTGKTTTIDVTQRRPDLFDAYRQTRGDRMKRVPSQEQLAKVLGAPLPKWQQILARTLSLPLNAPGYALGVLQFLNAVLHPNVTSPGDTWADGLIAGRRFAAIHAADGPLSFAFTALDVETVHVIVCNTALDAATGADIARAARLRHTGRELSLVVVRSQSAEGYAAVLQHFVGIPLIVLDDELLRDVATARDAGDMQRLLSLFVLAA